uniref:Uncharacterized protein n=1 Tax=Wuchereria bancrofti TaxID=6293 RepID=A0AAF5PWL3_WUCBA
MAFYFALMNISNASFDNSTKRRSSSLSRNHRQIQRSDRRRCTIISNHADALFKQEESLPQNYRSRYESHEVQKVSKLRNDIQEKKVTFEKRESKKPTIKINNFIRSHAFLDKHQKINTIYKEKTNVWDAEYFVTTFHNADVEYKQRNVVKNSLSIRKIPSYGDITDAWLLKTKRSNFKQEEKVNERYPLRLSAYSNRVQHVNDRSITSSIVQNATNELIEQKLVLSAPARRRNFWKSATISRRRSASDNHSKYTSSYFSSGFHFVENESKTLKSDCNEAISTDENYIFSSYIYSKRLPHTDDSWRIR